MKTLKPILVKGTTIINELYVYNYSYEITNKFIDYVFNLGSLRDEDTLLKIDRQDIFDEVMTNLLFGHNLTSLEQSILNEAIGEKIEMVGEGIEQAIINNEKVIADYCEFILLA